jgi:hypothetical protein
VLDDSGDGPPRLGMFYNGEVILTDPKRTYRESYDDVKALDRLGSGNPSKKEKSSSIVVVLNVIGVVVLVCIVTVRMKSQRRF